MKAILTITKKHFLCMVLAIAMLLSLMPMNSVTANAETYPRLVFVNPDWDNDCAMPSVPEYITNIDWVVDGCCSTFYIGTLIAENEFTPVTDLESLTISNSDENIRIAPNEKEIPGLYDVFFKGTGTYTVSVSDSNVDITVIENRIKLYSDDNCLAENEFERDDWGNYLWGDENNSEVFEAYIKIVPNDGETLVDELYVPTEDGRRICIDETLPFNEGWICIEKTETEYLYKITRDGNPSDAEIRIGVDCNYENEGETVQAACQDIGICFSFSSEEGPGEDSNEGLFATNDLIFDWATREVNGIQENANWSRDLGADITGLIAEFDIVQIDEDEKESYKEVDPRDLKIYDADYDENDELVVSKRQSQTATVGPYGDSTCFAEIRFSEAGTYVVSYVPEGKEELKDLYRVVIHVDYPLMGWYTKPEMSGDAFIFGDYEYSKKNGDDTIYFIIKDSQDNRLKEGYEPILLCGDMANQLSNSAICDVEEYEGDVDGTAKVYKLTLKSKMRADIGFKPTFEWYVWNEEKKAFDYQEDQMMYSSLCISYNGENPIDAYEGDIIRYTGEDGTDWVGFSGCFISKECYETGQTWFKGRYPNGICYYVHARTIQEVVDKLLEVAGKRVTLWDDLKQEDAEVIIPNTGYIELNMSYRDASYEATVQTEQYVYAPASIKGILMNAANNPYMIQRKDLAGNPIYMEEGGQGDDIKWYDDVIEFTLTEAAKTAGKGIAKSVDGVLDTEDLRTVYGIRLQMDESTEAGFNAETIGKLKAMVEAAGGSWTNIWELPNDYDGPIIIQKAVYDSEKDAWETENLFYLLANEDIAPNRWGDEQTVFNSPSVGQPPHKWPSLHVNASTQVRIQGLWTNDAKLYIGFFEGQDDVYTDAYDTRFTSADIGTTNTVTFELGDGNEFNFETGKFEPVEGLTSDVEVHVVKAESNTNITDTYSEGTKKAEIVVDQEAVSDFVPMTDEEKQLIIDGGILDVDMSISKVENTQESEVKDAVSSIETGLGKISSDSQVDYINLDIDYQIKADNDAEYGDLVKITETNEPIVISVPMNSSMKDKKEFDVYRYHDGKVAKLPAWIDEETGNICFATDKFSTYAIAGGQDLDSVKPLIPEISVKGKFDVSAAVVTMTGKKPVAYAVTSSDKKAAKVAKDGILTAKKAGEVEITAYADKKKKEEIAKIKVVIKDTKVPAKDTISYLDEIYDLKSKITELPSGMDVRFSIPDKQQNIAKVDAKTGIITPVKAGKVKVAVEIGEGKNVAKFFTAIAIKIPTFGSSKAVVIKTGKSKSLAIKNVKPDTKIRWIVSNTSIAKVVEDNKPGKIKVEGLKAGKITLTADINGHKISKEIEIIE